MDQDLYWNAILNRDCAFDGQFVFGVRSTGIYCRPGCAARRPRREMVTFYATPAEAEAAGFRACKRCKPDQAPGNADHRALVEDICRWIDAHAGEKVTLESLSAQFHLSPFHLQRTFKAQTGMTPRQYTASARARRLKEELRQSETVTGAIYGAGYGSSSGLYAQAGEQLGMTPAAYQNGGKSMQIRYTIVPCALGWLLLAATGRGVCAVSLGGDPQALESALRREFPRAELQRDGETLSQWVRPVADYLAGSANSLDLPLDIQATAFQWKVWQALRAIPYGQTRTYSEVAERIGQPGAARAVARACASNHAALIIPCHRVVGAGGKLSGYRWGIERKQALLEMERK